MAKLNKSKLKKAVILLSGGLDSATVLFYLKNKGYKLYCLIFDYGQRHKKEIKGAKSIARKAKCDFQVMKISLPWKGSSLLDKKFKAAKSQRYALTGTGKITSKIPDTYVPARNTIFLSFALSYAEAIGASEIFIGANAVDFSGYPDCRPKYYKVFNNLCKVATKAGVENKTIKIYTPLINMSKAGIVSLAKELKVPIELTWSCYHGGKSPCGVCDSCKLREKGMFEAKLK